MSSESTLLHSSRLTKSNSSNFNHIHIICPYKFCTCCKVCNSYSFCSCKCHSIKPKTQVNSDSLELNHNNSDKIILSELSNDLYQKTKKYINYNNNDNSSNQTHLNKKIFYAKLYKNIGGYNRRSLSEINDIGEKNKNERKQYLHWKEKYFNKSYMNNFYSNDNTYNYNYDNKKLLSNSNLLTERDNNICKGYSNKGQKEFETNKYPKDKVNEKIKKYFNTKYDKDIDKGQKNKKNPHNYIEDKNTYLNNNFRKTYKYKSTLNSPQKEEKIREIISNSRLKKYQNNITFENNKNNSKEEKAILVKNYNNKVNKNYNPIKKNNIIENNKFLNHNYLTNKDKNNKQINRNRNQLNSLNQKKNKTSYAKLNANLNNIRKHLNNNINKIIRQFKKEKLKVESFSFSLINLLINNNSIEYLKKELSEKNKELHEYKNKYFLLSKELELYKSEIIKLKTERNRYINNSNLNEKKIIYKRKNSDEMGKKSMSSINDNNNYKIRENDKIEEYNDYNISEKQTSLFSRLKIKSDLNIDKDYYLSYYKNQIISDKLIFAINPLTKSKSILCFDYDTKTFSYKDYADFGDFQETFIKSLENNKEKKINKNIYLTIDYNFFIITGENFDTFYVFNVVKRTINKLCSLKNNHSNGSMINYLGDIVCISGNYNKKVELYNQIKNEWIELPELNTERSNCASVLFREKYIFCLFGYNYPMKQHLNTIEYLDIEKYKESNWKYLQYKNENLFSLYFNYCLSINYNNEKIIIVGGSDGQKNISNIYFYQLIISKDFENNNNNYNYIEKTNRKLKDINYYQNR